MATFKDRTIQGLKWSTLGIFSSVFLQVIILAVMARLLDPSDYGVLALANVFVRFAVCFSHMGLGTSIIQKESLSEEDIRSSFTLAVAFGVIFSILIILIAPLSSLFFNSDAVTPIVKALGISFIFSGVSLIPMSLMKRELNFKDIALIENISVVFGSGVVGIALAFAGCGVWSLVAGVLSQQALVMVTTLIFTRHFIIPLFSLAAFRKNLFHGMRFSINNFFDYIFANLEVFFIGRFFSERFVGLYNRGNTLATLPTQHFVTSISRTLFPVFSRLQTQKEDLSTSFFGVFITVGLIAGAISGGMFSAAHEIVFISLGEKWKEAIYPFQILSLAIPCQFLISLQGILLDSLGHLDARSKARFFGVLLKIGALSLGLQFGFHGVLWAILCAQVLQQLVYLPFVLATLNIKLRKCCLLFLFLIGNAVLFGIVVWGVSLLGRFGEVATGRLFFAQIVAGLLTLLMVLRLVREISPFSVGVEMIKMIPFVGRLL